MNIINYNIFPSLVNFVECDDFSSIQQNLISWIYSYKTNTESVVLSNRGGWQSPSDFYVNDYSFDPFKDYILKHAYEALKFYNCDFYLSNMWININSKGNYNILHDHPLSTVSGVIWIKTHPNCGNLVFHNPHSFTQYNLLAKVNDDVRQSTNYFGNFHFEPSDGCMVLFPSDLMHVVENNDSGEDRISISFNLGVN